MTLRQPKSWLRVLMLLLQLESQGQTRLRVRTRPVLMGLLNGPHFVLHWWLRFSLDFE